MSKRIVIVEDEFFVSNHLKKILEGAGYEVVAQFHEGEHLLQELDTIKNALFLLDIQLSSEVDGIRLAKELNKRNLPFIFITANTEDATLSSAIHTKPLAYISKPFKEIDVLAGLALGFQHFKSKIKVSSNSEVYYLNLEDILYLQSDNVYVLVFTKSKKYVIRKQLKDFECELGDAFKRCHRSYIVNMNMITKVKGDVITIGETEIPISKSYKNDFA